MHTCRSQRDHRCGRSRTCRQIPWRCCEFLGALARPAGARPMLACHGTGVFLVPQFLHDPLNIVGQAAVPLILCAFGISLRGARPLASREGRQATITAAALKNAFMPAMAFALASAMGFTSHNLYACVVLAALPSAQNVFNYAARYNAGTTFARDGVLLSTICSPVCILAIALLLS